MVLASVCLSEETRAYRATRREVERAMVINLQPVFARRERTRCPSGPTTGRPGRAESRAAPTRRRDPETLVPSARVVTRERLCEWAGNGDGQTWPPSLWQIRKVRQAKPPPGTLLD